jgi:hypothetical protein
MEADANLGQERLRVLPAQPGPGSIPNVLQHIDTR